MAFWDRFRRIQRSSWHVCYECLKQSGNVAEEAIFYYDGPPESDAEGHATVRCPRCRNTNTRSFQFLRDMREEAALYGLERIVRTNPRSRFPVKRQAAQPSPTRP